MDTVITTNGGSIIVPGSHPAFPQIKTLAADTPANQGFFIKGGMVAEIHKVPPDGDYISIMIREAGLIGGDEYAILDGERRLVEAWIRKWSNGH